MADNDSQPITFEEAMAAKIASGEIEPPAVKFSLPPKTPAQWEYTTKVSENPTEDHVAFLNETAVEGWRLVTVWYFTKYVPDEWGLLDPIPCAKFFFVRENPEYLKALERERRSKMARSYRRETSSDFISADARRETWRSLDRPDDWNKIQSQMQEYEGRERE